MNRLLLLLLLSHILFAPSCSSPSPEDDDDSETKYYSGQFGNSGPAPIDTAYQTTKRKLQFQYDSMMRHFSRVAHTAEESYQHDNWKKGFCADRYGLSVQFTPNQYYKLFCCMPAAAGNADVTGMSVVVKNVIYNLYIEGDSILKPADGGSCRIFLSGQVGPILDTIANHWTEEVTVIVYVAGLEYKRYPLPENDRFGIKCCVDLSHLIAKRRSYYY